MLKYFLVSHIQPVVSKVGDWQFQLADGLDLINTVIMIDTKNNNNIYKIIFNTLGVRSMCILTSSGSILCVLMCCFMLYLWINRLEHNHT